MEEIEVPGGPLVSIGLPVYNGAKYLEQAIDSLLAQTYPNFELIIADNCSNDGTAEICARYAESDPRVRFVRNERNIGGGRNANLTFELARGKYFRWAAHDDVCKSTMLEAYVQTLETDRELILCYSPSTIIDASGAVMGEQHAGVANSSDPSVRFRGLAFRNHGCEAMYGLIRSDALRKTALMRNYTDSDRVLLCHLALLGRFVELDESLFLKRVHSQNQYHEWRYRMLWFRPGERVRWLLPNWMQVTDYVRIVVRSDLSWRTKVRCFATIGHWAIRYSRGLVRDILVTAKWQFRQRPTSWQLNWE